MFGNPNESRQARPPGLGVAFATAPFLAMLAGVRYDWWDYSGPAAAIFESATVVFAVLGLVAVGLFWIVRSYGSWKRERKLSWKFGLAPLVVTTTALAFILVQTPTVRGFDRANGEMEKLAVSMLQDHTKSIGPTDINGLRFSTVFIRDDNCVYFVDSKRSDVRIIGWLYTGHCNPDPDTFGRLDPLGNNWYAFDQST